MITPKEFRYYKNRWSAYCWDIKPLLATSIRDIVAIFRVILDLPQEKRRPKELKSEISTYKELYEFEIFTGESEYPYLDEKLDENVDIERLDKLDLERYNGFQMWENYLDKKKKSPQPFVVNKDHLMRPPVREHRLSNRETNFLRDKSSHSSRGSMDIKSLTTRDKKQLQNESKISEGSKNFNTG